MPDDLGSTQLNNIFADLRKAPTQPVLDGYSFVEPLGRGGQGDVWKASRADDPSSFVAIKILKEKEKDSPETREYFTREVNAIRKLKSTGTVPLVESVRFTKDNHCCLIMELQACDLKARIDGSPLSGNEAARLVLRLAEIVGEFHSRKIFHRDLKPSNILLASKRGDWISQARVGDFGLVYQLSDKSSIAALRDPFGTLNYLPPEIQPNGLLAENIARGGHDAIRIALTRIDVFGLGAILFCCITGKIPNETGQICAAGLDACTIDHQLAKIAKKAIAENPAARYSSANELASDLTSYLETMPGSTTTMPERVRLAYRRIQHKTFFLFAFVVMLGLAIGLLWISGQTRKIEQDKVFGDRRAAIETYAGHIRDAQKALENKSKGDALDALNCCDQKLRGWEWNYLRAEIGDKLDSITLPEVIGVPTAMAWSAQHGFAIGTAGSASLGNADAGTFKVKRQFRLPPDRTIKQLAFGKDGKSLLAAGLSKSPDETLSRATIVCFDLSNPADESEMIADDFHILKWDGKPYHENTWPALIRFTLDQAGTSLAYPAEGLTAKIRRDNSILALREHESGVLGVSFSPDGGFFATAGGFGKKGFIKTWLNDGTHIASFNFKEPVLAVQFISPKQLAAVFDNGMLMLQLDASGKVSAQGELIPVSNVRAVAWHDSGQRQQFFVAGTGIREMIKPNSWHGHDGHAVVSLAIRDDGGQFASVAGNGIRIWATEPAEEKLPELPKVWKAPPLQSDDGAIVVLRNEKGYEVKAETADIGQRSFLINGNEVLEFAFVGDRLYARKVEGTDRTVYVYDAVTGRKLFERVKE